VLTISTDNRFASERRRFDVWQKGESAIGHRSSISQADSAPTLAQLDRHIGSSIAWLIKACADGKNVFSKQRQQHGCPVLVR
jgi:hypothetical protein